MKALMNKKFLICVSVFKPSNINSIFLDECNKISRIINDFQNNKSSDIPIELIKKSYHVLANNFNNLYAVWNIPRCSESWKNNTNI